MKAEVNKTVEVVLRLSEAEAKCLREMMRCCAVGMAGLQLSGRAALDRLIVGADETFFAAIDDALREAGIS